MVLEFAINQIVKAQQKKEDREKKEHFQIGNINISISNIISSVISIAISAFAAYLSWECNRNTHTVLRVVYAVLAFIFGLFYLIYYAIYRVVLKKKCY